MENDRTKPPFIKKFKTRDHHYIYDVNSNRIIRVDSLAFELIDEINHLNLVQAIRLFNTRYPIQLIQERYEEFQRLKLKNDLFSSHHPMISSGFEDEKGLKFLLESGMRQLILQLSFDCNQRCSYCPYASSYHRSGAFNDTLMTWNIASKALDFFIKRSTGNHSIGRLPAITFYGGEPIMNFGLLRNVIDYTKKKDVFNLFKFSFTTNGTLLNDEIIKFLVKNNISIVVSLDGPKRLNDRYRVFINRKGTFDQLLGNLKTIKRISRDYFEKKVSFNVGIVPPYDFPGLKRFFYRTKFFEPFRNKLMFFFVNMNDNTFFQDYKLEAHKAKVHDLIGRMEDNYVRALINGTYDNLTIEKTLFFLPFHEISCRPIAPMGLVAPPRGSCIPGLRRLFVDITGSFYMCERVGSNYPIGHVNTGFDYRRILDFYKKYDEFFSHCKECWAVRLCTKCFNNIREGGEFDLERKYLFCRKKIKMLEQNLVNYCRIIEKNPGAFQFMEEAVVT